MPAPLSLSRATVTTPTDEFKNVSLIVRTGHAVVRSGRDTVIEATVVRVEATSRTGWTLTLDDGSQWTVVRTRNCGCGK